MLESYDSENIQVLKGLQAVRVRPSMYIGDTGTKGLHHLVWEITDNSVDEAMAGHCNEINVIIEQDGETISIEDNGRGIPVETHKGEGKSALEVVLTVLHAGGKFDGSGYEASGGLHGVGASVVNALSAELIAEVWRDGGYYTQNYSRGTPLDKVTRVRDIQRGEKKTGTKITWHADIEIFKQGIKLNEETLLRRFREVVFLNKGLKITFENKVTGTKETFLANGGISDYVTYLTEAKTNTYPSQPLYAEHITKLETRNGNVQVQVAINWAEEDDETILSFANNINTVDGGTHMSGFKTAVTRVVNTFARSTKLLKESRPALSGDDIREGMTAIISVRLPQPEFVGQTKAKLGTVEMESIVSKTVTQLLTEYFEKNSAVVKKIVERAIVAQEARDAAKKSAAFIKRKSVFGSTRLPGKLSDCNSRKRELCELFIVEGDSAGGSAKIGRDNETQAILPIRGKIINAEKSDLIGLLKNQEIQNLIMAIGTNIRDDFDIENRRYEKVILMCDADDDGSHITTLLMTFFYRYMKPLVTGGHLYIAQPPLFKVEKGKSKAYCFNLKELADKTKEMGEGCKVVRFKGLGEMNADELGITTMDKTHRHLIQLQSADLGETERMLSVLMGNNAQSRKDHITKKINGLISV